MLKSQQVRSLSPEMDPLRMGMGWTVDDLSKPQIMVESTFGDSHPGSAHLDQFVKEAVQAVNDNGGKAARYFATDMCDGIAQGHDGINYSLPHRDAIVNLVEAQANGLPCVISDTITEEIIINREQVCRLSLSDDKNIWAKAVYDAGSSRRRDTDKIKKELVHAHFDIHTEAKRLIRLYQENR